MMSDTPTLDVIIPCYNAAATLERAALSALTQPGVRYVWLVDDASTDGTRQCIAQLAQHYPQHIQPMLLMANAGAASARNAALWQSQADWVAFLDADDAYAPQALDVARHALQYQPHIGLLRLAMHPQGFPARYTQHPDFARAWQSLCMTSATNMVWQRSLLLACGGFPQDALFRRFGGEDAALGIAMTRVGVVGTLFDSPGVHHFYRAGIHASYLLDSHLFGQAAHATEEDFAQAEAVTQRICQRLRALQTVLAVPQSGTCPLYVQTETVLDA